MLLEPVQRGWIGKLEAHRVPDGSSMDVRGSIGEPPGVLSPSDAHAQIDKLESQLRDLQSQLDDSRRRDEAVQRIDEELRLAARLQRDFLPRTLPAVGKIRFSTLFRPASHVSGDLYDVFRVDENHVGVYIADAVGHGVPAALLTIFLKTSLQTKQIGPGGYTLLSPGQAMTLLNQALVSQGLSHATFATAIYALINVHTLQVRYTRAGHPWPIVLPEGQSTLQESCEGGPLLGIFNGEVYQTHTLQLAPGDRLLFYTDGVEVAFTHDPGASLALFREHLAAHTTISANQIISQLSNNIDDMAKIRALRDDVTLVLAEAVSSGQ